MVNFFRAAAAGLLAFVGAARAAPADVGNEFAAGYPGSVQVLSTSPLAIRYSTSQPDDRNWVGIYAAVNGGGPDNQQLGAQPSLKWAYAAGLDGTVTLPTDGLPAGDYKAYFLTRDGYAWMGAPVQFALGKTFAGALSVTGGYPIRVQYNTTQPSDENWVGLYFAAGGGPDTGVVDDQAVRWAYAGGSPGAIEIPADGLGDGVYKAFLLPASGYQSLAPPQIFTQGNAVFKGVLAVDYASSVFSIRYTTQRPAAKNWIGIWRLGEGPDGQSAVGAALAWEYVADARGVKKVDGSNLPSGQYQAFLLANDGYSWLASPIAIHK
ncbi:exonuclease III [Cordyceps militaris]|uniref:Exonuclease III n=1 Tax=Cordyceps militaris TaxID=73501 RepID=A0A2H4SBN9_CORMI|nr:exonuclease III [Cordyceps militaris]